MARYKQGDIVVLTTDKAELARNCVDYDLAGCSMIINTPKSLGRYSANPIGKFPSRVNCGWEIMDSQIIGLLEIDWEKRIEKRRCNDA